QLPDQGLGGDRGRRGAGLRPRGGWAGGPVAWGAARPALGGVWAWTMRPVRWVGSGRPARAAGAGPIGWGGSGRPPWAAGAGRIGWVGSPRGGGRTRCGGAGPA